MPGLAASLAAVSAAVIAMQPVAAPPPAASAEPCVIILPLDPKATELPEMLRELIAALQALVGGNEQPGASGQAPASGNTSACPGVPLASGSANETGPPAGERRTPASPETEPAPGERRSDPGAPAPDRRPTGDDARSADPGADDPARPGKSSDDASDDRARAKDSGGVESGAKDSGGDKSGADDSGSGESGADDAGGDKSSAEDSGGDKSSAEDSGGGESGADEAGGGESGADGATGENASTGDASATAGRTDDRSADAVPSPAAAATGGGAQLPGDLLSLENWFLTLPTGPAGDPDSIDQPELLTYSSEFFQLTPEGDGVVFRSPAGGVTTENSKYPRSELREMNGEEKAAWSNTTGTHVLETRQAITEVPPAKPEVVAAQIHDGGDDVMQIRLEGQTLVAQYADGQEQIVIDPAYQLGTPYDLRIVAADGRVTVFYNGEQAAEIARSGTSWYFKVGAYTQSNPERGDSADAAGEVVVYSLAIEHSGT
jgi:hypothetical protein